MQTGAEKSAHAIAAAKGERYGRAPSDSVPELSPQERKLRGARFNTILGAVQALIWSLIWLTPDDDGSSVVHPILVALWIGLAVYSGLRWRQLSRAPART